MAHKMSATDKALLSKRNLLLMIDEADLLTPGNRDAMSRVLQIVRGDARPNGGAQVFEVGDPMQGAPYLSVREKNDCIPGRQELGARKEVTLYTYLHVLAFLEVHTDARYSSPFTNVIRSNPYERSLFTWSSSRPANPGATYSYTPPLATVSP